MLYTLTISGVAYLVKLRSNLDYGTSSFVPASEIVEYNTQVLPHYGAIRAVAASDGCLLIGRNDGSISCFQLGTLDPSSPGPNMVLSFKFLIKKYVSQCHAAIKNIDHLISL